MLSFSPRKCRCEGHGQLRRPGVLQGCQKCVCRQDCHSMRILSAFLFSHPTLTSESRHCHALSLSNEVSCRSPNLTPVPVLHIQLHPFQLQFSHCVSITKLYYRPLEYKVQAEAATTKELEGAVAKGCLDCTPAFQQLPATTVNVLYAYLHVCCLGTSVEKFKNHKNLNTVRRSSWSV